MRSFQLLECACCTHRLRFAVVRAERMCIAGPCSHPRLTSSLRICGSTTSRRSVSLPTTSSSDTTCTVSRLPHRVLWLRCARSYWQAVTPGTFAPASGSRGEKRGEDYRYQKGEMVNYWQAETTGSFAPALRKQRGEGLRGLLACQGLEDPTTRTSAGGSRGEKGGEDYWYRTRSSVNYWQASNSWHFCSKQFVRLLIYHRQTTGTFAPALRQQRGERCEDYWHTKVVSGHYWQSVATGTSAAPSGSRGERGARTTGIGRVRGHPHPCSSALALSLALVHTFCINSTRA